MEKIITQNCSHCSKDLPLESFSKGGNKNGKRSWCKTCVKEHNEKPENKERTKVYKKQYYQDNRSEDIQIIKSNIGKYLYQSAKARAKQRGIEFSITLDDFIVPKICPLLGIEMQYNEGMKKDNSYSLDRINPTKGYVPGNVWVVSLRANRIKNDATLEELELIIKNLKYA